MREKTYTRWVWNEELQDEQLVEYGTGKYVFDEEDKIAIVAEYVGGNVPASQIQFSSGFLQLDGQVCE